MTDEELESGGCMTENDVYRMWHGIGLSSYVNKRELLTFAKAIAQKEREACAYLCIRFHERGMVPAECAGAIMNKVHHEA